MQVVEQGTNMSSANIGAVASSQFDYTPVSLPNQGMFQVSNDQKSIDQRGHFGVSQMDVQGGYAVMHDENVIKSNFKTPVITSFVKYAGKNGNPPITGTNAEDE